MFDCQLETFDSQPLHAIQAPRILDDSSSQITGFLNDLNYSSPTCSSLKTVLSHKDQNVNPICEKFDQQKSSNFREDRNSAKVDTDHLPSMRTCSCQCNGKSANRNCNEPKVIKPEDLESLIVTPQEIEEVNLFRSKVRKFPSVSSSSTGQSSGRRTDESDRSSIITVATGRSLGERRLSRQKKPSSRRLQNQSSDSSDVAAEICDHHRGRSNRCPSTGLVCESATPTSPNWLSKEKRRKIKQMLKLFSEPDNMEHRKVLLAQI